MKKIYTYSLFWLVVLTGISSFGQIDAVDDTFYIPHLFYNTNQSVITNDTLNGNPVQLGVSSGNVVLTCLPTLYWTPLSIDPTTGIVYLAPNTPPGMYTIPYTICEINNPTNCDTATATVTVNPPPIDAVPDNLTSENGLTTQSVTMNDSLNGVNPVLIGNLPFEVVLTSTPTPYLSIDSATGVITIVPNTPAGTYYIQYTICEVTNPTNCDTATATVNTSGVIITDGIKFNAFLDANANGIQDANEQNFHNVYFSYQKNSDPVHYVYNYNGDVKVYENNPSNNYQLNCNLDGPGWWYCNPNYSLTTPSYSNVTVPIGSGITTYNFPVILNNTICEDIGVSISGWNAPRLGFTYNNWVYYSNNGNQNIAAGIVTFTKDNAVTITSTDTAVTQTPSGFTYNFTNLAPYEYRTIMVTMQVPTIPTVVLGQLLTNTFSITTPINDVNPYNNTSSVTQVIVGSYDPNEITESHGGKILHSGFTANDFLTYNIQFENTGTAAAENIKVNSILDSKLDETSIRMIDASGNYLLDRLGNNLTWKFNGINLPPSSSNSPTIGHGHITFQIKPKPGYAVGDIISNTANIYFDFNPAIITNTCTTEFVSSLNTDNFTFQDFKYYPNPVKNTLTISNASAIDAIEITSIVGQKMISKKVNDLQTEISLSELSSGIYFVKITAEGVEKTIKIVKE